MKKTSYLITVLFVSTLLYFFYSLFFGTQHSATLNHQTLMLIPHTAKEQQDLIIAQQRESESDMSGPLVARMSVQTAEANVLSLPLRKKETQETNGEK